MFCEKCGAKNKSGAVFCEKCGYQMNEVKNQNSLWSRFKNLPKKTKAAMALVLGVVVAAILVLFILLNNPVKMVTDNLDLYYDNYKEDYVGELKDIKKIIKDNKKDKDVLNKIKKASKDKIGNWVKNFNTSYKDRDDLDDSYQKIRGILNAIYDYELEYVLSEDLYDEYYELLSDLYSSKVNYLYGKEADSDYSTYLYYERVIEDDSYYKDAQKFINDYVSEELEGFLNKAKEMVDVTDKTDEEMAYLYIDQLDYLEKNKIANNIDLSGTDSYKEIVTNSNAKLMELIKKVKEEKEKNLEYNKILALVKAASKVVEQENEEELEDLEKELEGKLPDNLADKFVVDYKHSYDASYSVTIKDVKYESYVQFSFNGEAANRTYRLNKEYKKLKAKIVVGENWPGDFKGEIVITSGDKELFRSGEITKESDFKADIDIDITDIDDMKIEFITTNDGGYNGYYLYLVEPYLYK